MVQHMVLYCKGGLYLNAGEENQKFTCSHLNTDSPLAAKLGHRLVYAPSLGSLMGYSSVVQSLFLSIFWLYGNMVSSVTIQKSWCVSGIKAYDV